MNLRNITLFQSFPKCALLAELNCTLQLQQGFLVAGETLLPADIEVIHGHLLFTQHRGCLHCLDFAIISKFQIDRIDDFGCLCRKSLADAKICLGLTRQVTFLYNK